MSNRDNFAWRPNDNSATTLLRYDLEAGHWVKAFKSATMNNSASLPEVLGFLGLIISFVLLLIYFLILLIIKLVNFIIKVRFEARERKLEKEWVEAKAKAEITAIESAALKEKELAMEKLKPKLTNVTAKMIRNQDELFKKAALFVVNKQQVSIPILLFDLGLDFERACKIMDQLETYGIISGYSSKFQQKVLIDNIMTLQLLFELIDGIEKEFL
jgi:hypothetical protein